MVNLKIAETLGFTIPLVLLGRADELWHLALFRCDTEFGPLSAHIGHRLAIKLDLWVCALAPVCVEFTLLDRDAGRSTTGVLGCRENM